MQSNTLSRCLIVGTMLLYSAVAVTAGEKARGQLPKLVTYEQLKELEKEMRKAKAAYEAAKEAYDKGDVQYTEPCYRVAGDDQCGCAKCLLAGNKAFQNRVMERNRKDWQETKDDINASWSDWKRNVTPSDKSPEYFPWMIRESALEKEDLANPATFSWLINGNGPDTYSIDGVFAIDPNLAGALTDSSRPYEFFPYVEYHRNNASSALKDTLMAGFKWSAVPVTQEGFLADFYECLSVNGGWRRDRINEGSALFARLAWTPIPRCIRLPVPVSEKNPKRGGIRLNPELAIDYRHVYDGLTPAHEGNDLIANASLDVEYFPVWLSQKVVLTAGYDFWAFLADTDANPYADDDNHYFKASLDYYLDGKLPVSSGAPLGMVNDYEKGHFAISLVYTHGDNPDTGARDEDQLALSFRIFY